MTDAGFTSHLHINDGLGVSDDGLEVSVAYPANPCQISFASITMIRVTMTLLNHSLLM